ncbi:hypothetical protein [Nitrosospira multiformis]|uniref:hypothetical protein n=1 Tax=Nitrosospira multiformis TaxID=1231 RepID=UPI001EE67558|nr:hypothetical protein [Nitrosospira multiformis]
MRRVGVERATLNRVIDHYFLASQCTGGGAHGAGIGDPVTAALAGFGTAAFQVHMGVIGAAIPR